MNSDVTHFPVLRNSGYDLEIQLEQSYEFFVSWEVFSIIFVSNNKGYT